MYEKEKLKEKKMPEAGDKIKGKVVSIEEGSFADFISDESLAKFDGKNPEDPCINVTVATDKGFEKSRVIALPKDNEVHPNSALGKWKTAYKEYPAVGQEVYLICDAKGYYQFNI